MVNQIWKSVWKINKLCMTLISNWSKHQVNLNSLAPWTCGSISRRVISKDMLGNNFMGTSCETALRWMPWNTFGDKSTLVQVMAWCRQATSHYLNQCWPRSMSSYGVTRPQWVNIIQWGLDLYDPINFHPGSCNRHPIASLRVCDKLGFLYYCGFKI